MTQSEFIASILPQLIQAAATSLLIAACSSGLGFFGGVLLGVAQTSHYKPLRVATFLYVTVIRGTPMLLQIMFFFLMLPSIGIHISAMSTAILAISINSSAYISQIIKSGISSVSRGQIEAAKTLGVTTFDITRYIILPQALRVVVPALGNEFITLIKDSSLASVIGVIELIKRSDIIISQVFNAITVYATTGLIYLAMTSLVSFIILKLEHSLNHVRN